MLSFMETPTGLTMVGPGGDFLRLPSGHQLFARAKELAASLPAAEVIPTLRQLMADPHKALLDWLEGFGFAVKREAETFLLDGMRLSVQCWEPLFKRIFATAGSPLPAVLLARQMGAEAEHTTLAASACLHWQPELEKVNFIKRVYLPKDAQPGDWLVPGRTPEGSSLFLVSYDWFMRVNDLTLTSGIVLNFGSSQTKDVLEQPVILGLDRTYKCEEFDEESGWLEDLSFDSLLAARQNCEDIRNSGSKARVINRITGKIVN